jgi:hypothetical protein
MLFSICCTGNLYLQIIVRYLLYSFLWDVIYRIYLFWYIELVTCVVMLNTYCDTPRSNLGDQCKAALRKRVFPHFVRERLFRDLIVCKFQGEKEPLREHIDSVFLTADFLEYQSSEQELVG